jgi:uncharacterized protein (TIGR02145 family)
MAENLRVTKYRNGDAIPNVTGSVAWMELTSAAYCNYNNEEKYSKIYGRLYNDYAAHDSRNIAPVGWHLPTLNDWRILIYNADPNAVFQRDGRSDSNAGIKLKETGFTHWTEAKSSISGTNETGFTAVPGGFRNPYGRNNESRFVEGLGGWWSSDSNPR